MSIFSRRVTVAFSFGFLSSFESSYRNEEVRGREERRGTKVDGKEAVNEMRKYDEGSKF